MSIKPVGLYIHFPFCHKKCLYCDFPSYAGIEHLMDKYLGALENEIKGWGNSVADMVVSTVFLGGGTPTLFHGEDIAAILKYCRQSFNISKSAEISIESNPGTLDRNKLDMLRKAGINRISIGMQAGQDKHIKNLGRIHQVRDVTNNVSWAREAGFHNINVDIMFGLPDQSLAEWMDTLQQVIAMGVEHISAYSLIIEADTPFFYLKQQGKINLPSEDLEWDMYHKAVDYLVSEGYHHYEVSNFAKQGKECKHNLVYWNNNEYIGIGSGAHSFLNGQRFGNLTDPKAYIQNISNGKGAIGFCDKIDIADERFETIMLGLRLINGINKMDFRQRFGQDVYYYYGEAIDILKEKHLIIEDQDSIRLTSRGIDVQNRVLYYFMN